MNNQGLQNQPGSQPGSFGGYGGSLAVDRQRVLRNTYLLLALSLVPTVLGAWLGVQTHLFEGMRHGLTSLVFFVGAIGLMFLVEKNKNSGWGVAFLMGFTFFMGLMLSRLVGAVLGLSNGPSLIMTAFGGTAAIFLAMASLATVVKRDLSGLAKFLFVGAVILMIAGIANIFLQSSALMLTMLVGVLGVFSAFMLVDVKRILDGGETNYISATLALYLDIYNVFQALLSLLGIFGGDRD
ncbi:Bax inhibitor-1/YccA family protein [Roseateles depolymerans]|uniref:FtsH-interacting integral membrane protein n=1 Tax=Roseateles depolymerans TaxID=76731 RepID=A0A0U3ME57_9BURK|nr:Bax inhibitor-1/YccA family protein [Roseateles depolymerans]ALV06601.1 FtsH-interacting integral membrane protein [Roseateles depolymerans]REG19577.1 modulator of FtsH protease [Roseateles depolymerans]